MHLALNFQRVDPREGAPRPMSPTSAGTWSRPGIASTSTPKAGPTAACPREVNVVPVAAPGQDRLERIWSFARNSEEAMRQASHDCSVGFINTWATT